MIKNTDRILLSMDKSAR